MSRRAVHFINSLSASQQVQQNGPFSRVTPKRLKISRQDAEALYRQLGHNLKPSGFHFGSNLRSAGEKCVSEVRDVIGWIPMLSRPNGRLDYLKKRGVT